MPKYLNTEMPKFGKHPNTKIPKFLKSREEREVKQMEEPVYDLRWIDEFVRKIKPYVYVRELDRLLILIPNQAYRLNDSGVKILRYLLHGHSVDELLGQLGSDAARRRDMHYFFCDLRAIVSGCLREQDEREAIDYYEFNGEFNEYPVLSEIAVTYRCNLQCDFCYVGERAYGELGTGDMKRILMRIFHEAQVPSVSFTGGEPLLREDIVELVAHATHIGMWTNLITNGTLLEEDLVQALKAAGLSSAQVSIEGPDPQTHDQITGVQGSFHAATKGIELLQSANIPVHTNTTVSRNNIDALHGIMSLAKMLGLNRLSMNLLIPCGAARDKRQIWVSYSEVGARVLGLKRMAAELGIKFLWYSPMPMCKFNPIAHGLGNKSCAAITGLLSVDPLGNIIPCSSWRKPVGSLLKNRFGDIWRSKTMDFYKKVQYAPDECRGCGQLDKCKGACPLYWLACGKKEINERA
jgi:radical SAM protein with 4Fe4S-binding SPASM domain